MGGFLIPSHKQPSSNLSHDPDNLHRQLLNLLVGVEVWRIDCDIVPDEGNSLGGLPYNIFRQKAHGFNRGMNATCM